MDEIVAHNRAIGGTLLDTRYKTLASNTIDYWMLPDDLSMTAERIQTAIRNAEVLPDASLQIYIHVPFCAQRCRFCAFSGGNTLDFAQADRYSQLVVAEAREFLGRTRIKGFPIRSVNIGGGSPDLLGPHIGYVLRSMRELPGFNDDTELAVEFTLSTTSKEFIEELARYEVTKVSFGVQSLDRDVRRYMRQPKTLEHLDQVLRWINGRIPVVNADLITGMPGQDLGNVLSDLRELMNEPRINAVSSYLLTTGAAPSLLAALESGAIPAPPSSSEQALMRLQTYRTFRRHRWVRKGTNTYIDPTRVSPRVMDRIAGNECIGASHYEAFLLGAGPQAVSYLPGARVENQVDIKAWAKAIDRGESPYHLPKCSDVEQKDTALWVFPLRWEGLPQHRLDRMIANGDLTADQKNTLDELEQEGLIIHSADGYQLSILGEVFMGHLVRDLKQGEGRRAVDDYIREGHELGHAISQGEIPDANDTNNRQHVDSYLHHGP